MAVLDKRCNCLTADDANINLMPLSVGKLSGICNPFKLGQKMTAPFAVFFRLSLRAGLIRFYSVMAGLFGQPHGWPRLVAVLQTHSNPPPKDLQLLLGGYSTLTRNTAMIDLFNRANYGLNLPTAPLFSIFLHRKPIAVAVNYRLAMRFKRRFPACTVKFIGFEGGAA